MTTSILEKAVRQIKSSLDMGDCTVFYKFEYYHSGFETTEWMCPFYALKWIHLHVGEFYRLISKTV